MSKKEIGSIGRSKRKGRYGVVSNVNQEDYVNSSSAMSGTKKEDVPLIKIDGINDFLEGAFDLPKASESKEKVIEVGFRILGFPVTEKLLSHLPTAIQSDQIGNLLPFLPFAYHKRFGETYSDRICSLSVRAGKCPICTGRKELFASPEYEEGLIDKTDIMKDTGFGTRTVALFFAMVYYDGEITGPHPVVVNLTNEKATMGDKDNFFDLIEDAATPKTLRQADVLPLDYYADGEGSRWLITEYKRTLYTGSKGSYPFWKISSVTPVKQLGDSDAADVWWPEIDGEDGAGVIDVFEVLNMPDRAELEVIASSSVNFVLRKAGKGKGGTSDVSDDTKPDRSPDSSKRKTQDVDLETITWEDLTEMDADALVDVGCEAGGDAEELELLGEANESRLRRTIAKMLGIKPSVIRQKSADTADGGR